MSKLVFRMLWRIFLQIRKLAGPQFGKFAIWQAHGERELQNITLFIPCTVDKNIFKIPIIG